MKLRWFAPCVFSLAVAQMVAPGARAFAQDKQSSAQGAQASAQSTFDGGWSVIIITEVGQCDAAYRYPLQIANGDVLYDAKEGAGVVQISGKVEPAGKVKVIVRRGAQQAVGVGTLSQNSGVGTWAGKSSGEDCSGRWEAKRN